MNNNKVLSTLENDQIRNLILRKLYKVHKEARGPKGVSIGIRDLQKTLKTEGVRQKEVVSNLDYLVQKEWVKRVEDPRHFTTPKGTTQSSISIRYKISDIGIDMLEGASIYQKEEHLSRINITQINSVANLGDNNIVNVNHAPLSKLLAELEDDISNSDDITDEQKLNAVCDVGTIQTQLAKSEPDKTIINSAWNSLKEVATLAGLVDVVSKIGELIS